MPEAQKILDSTYKKFFPKADSIDLSARNLEGELKVKGFKNLKELDCSSNSITYLEIIDCPKLEKVICNKNKLVELKFGKLKKLVELRCKDNGLIELELKIKNFPKLERIYCDSSNLIKNTQLKNKIDIITEARNILLVGGTGEGKSSLANVLIGENNDFKEVFKEGINGIAETKDIQDQEFEYKGIRYRVIDTVGIGDTKLKPRQVICMMAKGCKKVENGLTQVLFLVGGRFTSDQMEIYKILKKLFFDEGIVDYITIIRTKFPNFREEKICREDVAKLLSENKDIGEMIKSCKEKTVHVDNPPTNVTGGDKKMKEMQNELNKGHRGDSREKLLRHLESCKGVYRPEKLDKISKKIDEFAEGEIEVLKQRLGERKEELNKEGVNVESIKVEIREIKKEIGKKEELMEKDFFESVLEVSKEVKDKWCIIS